jgi:hypothetical protein
VQIHVSQVGEVQFQGVEIARLGGGHRAVQDSGSIRFPILRPEDAAQLYLGMGAFSHPFGMSYCSPGTRSCSSDRRLDLKAGLADPKNHP